MKKTRRSPINPVSESDILLRLRCDNCKTMSWFTIDEFSQYVPMPCRVCSTRNSGLDNAPEIHGYLQVVWQQKPTKTPVVSGEGCSAFEEE